MRLKFIKMQGVGNDYIYLDARHLTIPQPEKLAVQLADRHFGIGGDGLVLMLSSAVADVKMRMFNADGSEGAMCGNAVRCIAHYLCSRHLVDGNFVRIETNSGIKIVQHLRGNLYRVRMGKPQVNFLANAPRGVVTVDMGNPHAVIFPHFKIQNYDIARLGKRLEHSPVFPDGANVEFVQVIDEQTIALRVWERGTGETLGCGTGAAAAVVAAVEQGFCNREKLITVKLAGGELLVDYATENVSLIGPAVLVFTGEIEVDGVTNAN